MSSGEGRGWVVRYLRSLVVAVVAVAGFWWFGGTVDPDERQHLAGETRPETIDVVSVRREGRCRTRRHTYVLTYRIVGETQERDAEMCEKASPSTGRRKAWFADEGEVRFDSPALARGWILALPFLIAGLFTYVGRRRQQQRRARD